MRRIVEYMINEIKNNYSIYIHDLDHEKSIRQRMEISNLMYKAILAGNADDGKKYITEFYCHIKNDHKLYGVPENLLQASKSRTHVFHGSILAISMEKYHSYLYFYCLQRVVDSLIEAMKDPEEALGISYTMIDIYTDLNKMLAKDNYSDFSSKVISIIDKYITQSITEKEIAKKLFLNPSYLSRRFKDETGTTITDFINKRKIELAKLCLRDKNLNITQVAINSGFQDTAYFCRVFKKYMLITPSEYRKSI